MSSTRRPKRLAFFRALLPSWKFFDHAGPPYQLFCRFKSDAQDWGEWSALPHAPARGWTTLFLNARGNQRLAYATAIEELLYDATEVENARELEALVSYRLVARIALEQAPFPQPKGLALQFKISARDESGLVRDDALISKVHEANTL